jgi:DNA excision repair protein ERCC-3
VVFLSRLSLAETIGKVSEPGLAGLDQEKEPMAYNAANPIIIQSDRSVLLEVKNDLYEEARDWLARFAELEKSPEHIHTFRITPLSLWNAAASGITAEAIVGALEKYSKYDLPGNVRVDIYDYISRYGRVKLIMRDGAMLLVSDDVPLIVEISRHKRMQPFIIKRVDHLTLQIDALQRGHVKQVLVQIGFPAEDLAGYVDGAELPFYLLPVTLSGQPFSLRQYQHQAVEVFYAGGQASGGSGVIVLPCGAGKTMVGMGIMEKLQTATLILTTSTVAVRQWMAELLDKTDLSPDDIGEYTGLVKEIRPVTVTTYQILTHRKRRTDDFPHFKLFNERDWGLIVYDEVHLLPAPVFRITAEIQARRRLGLTATLIREDGRETDVFSLIGPKKYDVPWKDLEKQGWIATAECHEIRLPLPDELRMTYALAEQREKFRIAAENPDKLKIVQQLLVKHREDTVLIMGTYLDQLHDIAQTIDAPLITGKTPVRERQKLFDQIRQGDLARLVVSKVANFAVDLPDVNVAIQVSGTFGSRQEEAQRLGRILRPKKHGLLAHFYTLVTRDSRDQEFAAKRQLFLTEEGYRYEILYDHEIADYEPVVLDVEAGEPMSRLLPAGTVIIDAEDWSAQE